MASERANRLIVPTDLLYLLTFTAGMAAFWISGHASRLILQSVEIPALHSVLGIVATGGVYGLGMLMLSILVMRRLSKGAVIATVLAIGLGLVTAQIIVRLATGHVNNTAGLGLLTFVLYMCYGAIYALSLAAGRRFSKK
jgi:hypothetical protein